ncbi:MAG: heterodisulfide reductase-related iron-sulfur binding cluster [Actinomycetota bacterium]|nr:heterodisulfide reductase-related iron-sulfur binding cluster [Actinomycetota bacterium]MEC9058884.1 heterodisulfide reductase-related iron-sulfur binding cluster [Actinomycetota bacterium]MEE3257093.1 heterodisulfide reductase-related iron-sulfur binding cluster [Actinomycetota bacterium]
MMKLQFDLPISSEDLSSCVSCGLCLPHCPTYRVTQEEGSSPRGRIALMQRAHHEGVVDAEFVHFIDSCIQCRGCETACPAGVEFGSMMETTREALTTQTRYVPWWLRLGYRVLGSQGALLAASKLAAILQRLSLIPRSLGLPRIPLIQRRLMSSGTDVWLFTGCVMDAWMRDTHRAVQRVIESTGNAVAFPDKRAVCCGALHVHAGLGPDARRLATRTIEAFPGDNPILVDSAGCGAQLKEYGHLLGSDSARKFSERVFDVHEWLAQRIEDLPQVDLTPPRIAVQDPCHLRHAQRVHEAVYQVLGRYAEPIPVNDDGLCCGAGGAYATLHSQMASDVRDRKVDAIERIDAQEVASANPGCVLHLRSAGIAIRHPLEIVDALIRKGERSAGTA